MVKKRKDTPEKEQLELYLYKNSNPEFANDTFIVFLKNGDIRIDGSEYGRLINEYQGHDDEIAFSIHKKDFEKLINEIKKRRPRLKENKIKFYGEAGENTYEITAEQKEIFARLKAAFSEELAYRHINDLCHDIGIEGYDYEVYF